MSIIKNHEIENDSVFNSAICIIGSGFSAQSVATKLTDKKIIIIESGKIEFDKNAQQLNYLKQEGLAFRKNHINRIRQLGGSANLWANQLMTLEEFDISHRDWIVDKFAWPIKYQELKSLYDDVLQNLYKGYFEKVNFFNPIEKNEKIFFLEEEFVKKELFDFNNHFWPHKIEKFNLKTKFTNKLLNEKNIQFLENFTATEFKIDQDRHCIKSVKIQSDNKTCTINSGTFILACGAIENARIILNNERSSKLFHNQNTGRYFMDHPRACLGVIKSNKKLPLSSLIGLKKKDYEFRTSLKLSKKIQTENKILNSYAFIDPKYSNEDEIFFNEFLLEIKKLIRLKGIPKINLKKFNIKKILEQIYLKLPPQVSSAKLNGILYKLFTSKKYNFLFNEMEINYQGEQYPDYQNRVYLNKNKDIFNQNYCSINWQLNKMDIRTQKTFTKTLENKLRTNEFLTFTKNENINFTDASHHSGTTRMSNSRSDGVVDTNCKFHDIENLYVIGNSVFRTSGSANPGLTNMAISTRLGNYLKSIIKNT